MLDEFVLDSPTAYKKRQDEANQAARSFHERMLQAGVFPSCINCLEFNGTSEVCMKYNARPPAVIIARSCPEWVQDIPF